MVCWITAPSSEFHSLSRGVEIFAVSCQGSARPATFGLPLLTDNCSRAAIGFGSDTAGLVEDLGVTGPDVPSKEAMFRSLFCGLL